MSADGERPRLLVIAGHDSSGGAGVDADRHAAEAAGVAVRCVVTAWTVQDGSGVRELGAIEPARWRDEALSHVEWRPAAVKVGLLPGEAAVEAALEVLLTLRRRLGEALPVVLDPVIAASSGGRFLEQEVVRGPLRSILIAGGVILTPNLPEAEELGGLAAGALAEDLPARLAVAEALVTAGARAVLLKGGHGGEDPVRDLVVEAGGGAPTWLIHPRVPGRGIRGSGCRFATAVAARLAAGASLPEAAARAGEWVASLVRASR